ncbi:MAG: hypothetical protein QOK23_96 [Gammaproteobacteria bacterium]|jgi:hypothetical protein|nr:hypothetical protein [Gammaproteobacteria bacterium]
MPGVKLQTGTIIIDADAQQTGTTIMVYRPAGPSVTFTGNLAFDVKDGAVIITNAGIPLYAFAPGQWLSVNVDPHGT